METNKKYGKHTRNKYVWGLLSTRKQSSESTKGKKRRKTLTTAYVCPENQVLLSINSVSDSQSRTNDNEKKKKRKKKTFQT